LYLSKLEIFGFKSFAQKTIVNFNSGVTSIVGPNGCGKTNIVDAIRWCLGEQRSGALRSDKMENVIFNGTATKKPMGMAEVSLTIENNKGILPTEYSSVTITRRIFRSGESEYLLNKNICRLKDITNLFMDTGIGANAYSVIELKMVETILSNKADERRTMFEEAAGVNKYKLRRRLALRKLDEVMADLNRVNDIVSEVEKKVNSLERQAKKADKYNKISSSLRELELDLAERELSYFNIQKKEFREKKEDGFNKKLVIESELARLDDEIKKIREELNVTESLLKNKRSDITVQTEKVHSIQKSISIAQERKNSAEKNKSRYTQELDELRYQLTEAEELIEEGSVTVRDIGSRITVKENEKEELLLQLNELKGNLEEKRENLKEHSASILVRFKDISSAENSFSNVEKSLNSKNQTIQKLNERIQALTNNIAKTVGYIEELEEEKYNAQLKFEDAEKLYNEKQKEKEDLEKELTRIKEVELNHKSLINTIKDKITFIQSLIDNLEGVSKGAKALIESDHWAESSRTLLAHIGTPDEDYRFAVESALKYNLNNILVESLSDLKNGIEYLKSNDIGKASFFVVRDDNQGKKSFIEKLQGYLIKRRKEQLKKETGFLGFPVDFIITETKWKPFFEKILTNTVVVDTLETAFSLSGKYKEFNFTTLNGDYFDKTGLVEGGSAPKLDDSLFGRKQLLENLKKQFPEKEKELFNLRTKIEDIESRINSIDLKVLSEQGRILINDIATVDKQIARFEFEKNKAVDDTEKARQEIRDLAAESNKLDNEKNSLSALLEEQKIEKEKADQESIALEKDFRAAEEEYNRLNGLFNKTNIEHERLKGEQKNTENSIKRAEDSIENIKKSISKRETDISAAEEEASSLVSILEDKDIELGEFQFKKTQLLKEEQEIDSKYKILRGEISESEKQQSQLRKERETYLDLIHTADMKLNELSININNLKAHIQENYSLTLEHKEFDDHDQFDFRSRKEEVYNLKQQVKNLGPINLLAYSEFEEEKERLDFLHKQRDDLIDSEKDIIKTIEEINTTAQTQFAETFEKIRTNFITIFRGLFNPGDEADLRIEENADPLEAKIEIIAKPKGKRPTSIELLSGGEKTLTAIALLFAIYLVKPSPFCILDEIDAPLDDANIDRFTRIIKDFSGGTQFIIVTHNKRTMEAADTLYGVTMQEEGVSKLVSVRFNEELDFVS
jgi:chromosome segregation protein